MKLHGAIVALSSTEYIFLHIKSPTMNKLLPLLLVFGSTVAFAQKAKNTIVVVGAGLGYNQIKAFEGFSNKSFSCSDFPAQSSIYTLPAISQKITEAKKLANFDSHYHSQQAWSDASWVDSASIDYASAGTALATGFPTGIAAIGLAIDSSELAPITGKIKTAGKKLGIVTNSPLALSGTSAFYAKTEDASQIDTILKQYLQSDIDILFCNGHPEYDAEGTKKTPDFADWGGEQMWQTIVKSPSLNFASVADGETLPATASKILAVDCKPSRLAKNTMATLNYLNASGQGFVSIIESRDIEFAANSKDKAALIEAVETLDATIDSIINWIETNSSWDETALIVYSPYETGFVADTTFSKGGYWTRAVANMQAPEEGTYNFSINSACNTNMLTPFFAKGAGTEMVSYYTDHSDYYLNYYLHLPELNKIIEGISLQKPYDKPQNIILMIGDGAGENQLKAAQYYFGYKPKFESFPVRYFMSTYPGRNGQGKGIGAYVLSYDSRRAWTKKDFLFGYNNVTCSASSALAMGSGKKSYYYGLGVDLDFNSLNTIAQYAKTIGKSSGVITTMGFNNATPAAFGAHNLDRTLYDEIGKELLIESTFDVLIGAGHPEYSNDNELKEEPDYSDFGGKGNWDAATNNATEYPIPSNSGWTEVQDIDGDNVPDPWTLVTDKDQFKDIAKNTNIKRLLGITKVAATLQQKRKGDAESVDLTNKNDVPDLSTLAYAGLSVLNKNQNGFFVMIEGGAIDQAGHAMQRGRIIEESYDFQLAVDSVIAWIEANGGWEKNLLIVTADHETGLLTREEIANNAIWSNYHIGDNGTGAMPTMTFNHKHHSNQLVPFYAKGAGSDIFDQYADEFDFYRGRYLTNTEIGEAMHYLWGGTPGTIRNHKMLKIGAIEHQTIQANQAFEFTIPNHIFSDQEDNEFNFAVTIPEEATTWLHYDYATKQLYGTPTEAGKIKVAIRAFDGMSTGAATEVETGVIFAIEAGTETQETATDIHNAYPNPIHRDQRLTVNSENCIGVTLQSATGRVVFSKNNPGANTKIELSSLPKGQYILTLQKQGGSEVQTIIID